MNKKPLYLQISDALRSEIKSGKYKSGEKLPSENMLARKFSVSRLTAREAMSVLVNEGLIEKYQGKGYFCKNYSSGKKIHVLLDMSDYYFLPYYTQAISGVLEESGASFIAFDTKYSFAETIKILEKISLRDTDGLIIQATPEKDIDIKRLEVIIKKFREKNIPIVFLDADYEIKDTSIVCMNDEKIGLGAAEYLKKTGHGKVGAVCIRNSRISEKRMGAFINEFENTFIIYDDENLGKELEKAYKSGMAAIFCYNDFLAKKCIDELAARDIKIPVDVSIITADDTLISRLYNLTALTHAKEELGKFAAKVVLGKEIVKKTFDTKLVERSSVRRI